MYVLQKYKYFDILYFFSQVQLCQECINWAKDEKRTFLRQALEVNVSGRKLNVEFLLMFKANSYDRELKKKEKKRNPLKFNYSQLKTLYKQRMTRFCFIERDHVQLYSSVGHFCIVCFHIHFLYFSRRDL